MCSIDRIPYFIRSAVLYDTVRVSEPTVYKSNASVSLWEVHAIPGVQRIL